MEKLEYKGYFGTIEYSEGDKCFFGNVLDLSKSNITYEGENPSELFEDFKGAIDMYLEHCKINGINPEKPLNQLLNILLPSHIQNRVSIYAKNHGTTIDDFICESIERRLEAVI